MQKRLVSSIVKNILSILALAVCSCNNDIFVDKAISDADADVEFSVEGDGGSKSFDISTKHLEGGSIIGFFSGFQTAGTSFERTETTQS